MSDLAAVWDLPPVNASGLAPQRFVSVFDRRLPLPPGMETRLLHPEWDAETTAAYWYFWPLSETW